MDYMFYLLKLFYLGIIYLYSELSLLENKKNINIFEEEEKEKEKKEENEKEKEEEKEEKKGNEKEKEKNKKIVVSGEGVCSKNVECQYQLFAIIGRLKKEFKIFVSVLEMFFFFFLVIVM
jgi:chromatin remodeling complex protein RSC6